MISNIRTTNTFLNPKYAECIEACNHCVNVCEYCGSLCLREENEKNDVKMHRTLFYCADVCRFLLQSTHPVIIVIPNTSVKYMPKNVKDMI